MDAFYASVESARLGLREDEPLAVQQWNMLIAVNYAAKAAGVSRLMDVKEALATCPKLRLVHVKTIGGMPAPAGSRAGIATASAGVAGAAASSMFNEKVSLAVYREASARMFGVLLQFLPAEAVERASIDEAFLELTDCLPSHEDRSAGLLASEDGRQLHWRERPDWHTIGTLMPERESHARLLAAAVLVADIRAAVWEQLRLRCSAGIAHNKLVAKVASARNKPNRQTIVTAAAAADMLAPLQLRKLRGLGGKLGKRLRQLGVETVQEARALSSHQLSDALGGSGRRVWLMLRAIDASRVRPFAEVKSAMAAKTTGPLHSLRAVKQWLCLLASEIVERCEGARIVGRRARTLSLQYRWQGKTYGRQRAMPRKTSEDEIVAAAVQLWRDNGGPLPLTHLALVASKFEVMESGVRTLDGFFTKSEAGETVDEGEGGAEAGE
eukprot:PLAT15617.1.p1 GENE.PLAT15617.1~~PLAT15617.1.p1  ORF type:complete len:486 (+),score=197.49 PLAT15617.1:140-1459(+)